MNKGKETRIYTKNEISSYVYTVKRFISKGNEPKYVVENLQNKGLDSESAIALVNHIIGISQDPLKLIGKRNIKVGLSIFAMGLILTILSYFLSSIFSAGIMFIFKGAFVGGLGLLILGLAQYFSKSKSEKEKAAFILNQQIYGVEEPEKTWECPNCHYVNSNFTYTCRKCDYSLV